MLKILCKVTFAKSFSPVLSFFIYYVDTFMNKTCSLESTYILRSCSQSQFEPECTNY